MIDRVQLSKRIKDLAERDPKRRLIGSRIHKYELGTRLTEPELAALESSYCVDIPAEYRLFLLNVGNGGVGPGYGLEPLRPPTAPHPPSNSKMGATVCDENGNVIHASEYDDVAATYDPDGSNNTPASAAPFPLSQPYRSISDEMWEVQIPNWDHRLRTEHEARKSSFNKLAFGHGVLKLSHYGSGIYAVLVSNGPFRGQIWLTDPHMGDYVPASMRTDLHDSSIKTESAYALGRESFTFDSWYNHWLAMAPAEIEREYGR